MEDSKKRLVRELLIYLDKQKREARKMGKISNSLLNQGRENALHDTAQYLRQITKLRKQRKGATE